MAKRFGFAIVLVIVIYARCQRLVSGEDRLFTDVVNTHSGPVKGVFRKNVLSGIRYAAFMGIPYAEPPLKEKRFLPPVEIEPWEEVLYAIQLGDACPQNHGGRFMGDEDCLYLNVFTPMVNFKKLSNDLKAVMVWIHGGAFLTGSGNSSKYGPDFILDKDVILVTFNYRLGPIGFLNLNHKMIPGNAGLKDQNLVLKWVQKNIIKFGGDPNKITLIGQSAGAVAVDLHTVANSSRNLFARSIAMSGSVFCPWGFMTSEDAERQGRNLAKRLYKENNIKKNTLDSTDTMVSLLLNVPVETLVKHAGLLSNALDLQLPFVPSIEVAQYEDKEPFINECFVNKYGNEDINKGDHIMGFTSLETGVALSYIRRTLVKKVKNAWNKITNFWYRITHRHRRSINIFRSYFKTSSELMFSTGIDLKQKFLMTFVQPKSVYYYYFNYVSKTSSLNGVAHTEDLKYLFYRKDLNQPLQYFDPNTKVSEEGDPDAVTRNRVVTLFTNFAKYGKPTYQYIEGKDAVNVEWQKSSRNGGYLEISKDLIMHENTRPISNNVNIWQRKYMEKYKHKICVPELYDIVEETPENETR